MCIPAGWFNQKQRNLAAFLLSWLSVLIFIMGLSAGIIGIITIDRNDNWKIGGVQFITPTTAIAGFSLIIGIVTALAGIMGWVATNSYRKLFWKNFYLTSPFCFIVFVLTWIMLVAAIMCLTAKDDPEIVKKYYCLGETMGKI